MILTREQVAARAAERKDAVRALVNDPDRTLTQRQAADELGIALGTLKGIVSKVRQEQNA